ncbi:FecR family protein [Pedobacter foliorum]|uniref:FecR family protein n=1 Tax=Pedobacter foliorum TaxID=2739058 RepID=UPI001563B206|nr:FecR domain-containing protein [Pedobacter foliorum]NRF38332.1 FecR domain-containing protein [Pedobacter foliorum]
MNRYNIEALLDRYLKKETSIEENQLIEKWLAENGNADSNWKQLDSSSKDKWLSDVFMDIKASIKQNEPKVVPIKSQKHLWYKIAGVAAALILVFGLYLTWPLLEKRMLPTDLTSISIPDHEKKQITLADGTKVWLNAGSELKYAKAFDGKTREVYLSGEAYFDVRHDASRPFLIHTGKVLTTVLGTAFNIKEDPNNHTLEVTVTRGKVSVADDGKLLSILTSNQQVSVDLLTRKPTEKTVDTKTVIAWQDNDILFDDITFADAAIQLEQHFDVKIAFNNEKLKNCRFSGAALRGDKLDKILDVITDFNNASWKLTSSGHIMIYGEGCN